MPQLAIATDYLTAFARLSPPHQRVARTFTERLRQFPNAPGLTPMPVTGAWDPKAHLLAVGGDLAAVIVRPPEGEMSLLAWVDTVEHAKAWAQARTFEIHPSTGALQIVEIPPGEAEADSKEGTPEDTQPPIFAPYATDDLLSLGIPAALLGRVEALRSVEALEAAEAWLPEEAWEKLYLLAAGDPIETLLKGSAAKDVEPTSFTEALQHPDSQRRFTLVESDEALLAMLDAPLDKWRVFLHPDQAALVSASFGGPARVLGGAGTGKTVVALHRARYLARERFSGPDERILFTTYTHNLAVNLGQLLESFAPDVADRIEVVNLHKWAVHFMRLQGQRFNPATDAQRSHAWGDALAEVGLGDFDEDFYRDEWDQVIQPNAIADLRAYLRTPRLGRSQPMRRSQREAIWPVLEAYRQHLRRKGLMEWPDIIRETRLYLEQRPGTLPYRAVIVDEAQDLHPEDWRLLKAIAPKGAGVRDPLFIVGDAHQRIYGRPVVLGRLGIEIRGRARRLRINYRTTEEIRRWAVSHLEGLSYDDLDGGQDSVEGYQSITNGPEPEIRTFPTLDEELSYLIETLGSLQARGGVICLVARTGAAVDRYASRLKAAGIETTVLDRNKDSDEAAGIRIATMHRVKGLEFDHVLIAGLIEGEFPAPNRSHLPEEEHLARERSLLYVAASRARRSLTVTAGGRPSLG